MLRFTEYAKNHIPSVHLSIRDDVLEEERKVEHFLGYVGPEEHSPENRGFNLYPGEPNVWEHPAHPGKFFHFSGTSTPKQFDTLNDAANHDFELGNRQRDGVIALNDELVGHYRQHTALNMPEAKAIAKYTFTSGINQHLLANTVDSEHAETVSHLDTAISRGKTPADLVVYSGTSSRHSNLLRHNDKVYHPAFLSSSLSLRLATGFAQSRGGDVVALHIPKNHAGLYVPEYSSIPAEREFILPRKLTLNIDHSKRQVIARGQSDRVYLHHATISRNDS